MSATGTGGSDRLPRLLALVPWLLAHPGTPVGEVARVFDVSEKQVRSDLGLLWMCGLPGHTPGDLIDVEYAGDRVTLSNADTIARPLRLTSDEALALVVALRALAEVPGLHDAAEGPSPLERVLAKLETAAGAAVEPASRVEVRVETEERHLPLVRRAVQERRRLHLTYLVAARDETTERDVDPMRLLLVEGRWYLEAWCRRVDGVRLFRLDRIMDAVLLDEPASPPEQARPRDLSAGLYEPAPTDARVVLRLGPGARWVADYYPAESVAEEGQSLLVALRTPDTAWVRRLVLRLGGAARVLEPAALAAEVASAARTALSAYDDSGGPREG
ncbi:MAG: WYL domain-containing protein [Actinomycetota bacterium]|nr:WYL domain-containing protein [Actinomycetota bacterium]